MTTANLNWRISSFSGTNGSCVELAETADGVAVRNSNARDAGTIHLTKEQFSAWLAGAKAGEFDDLS
jgi:hypothetical protein